MEVSWEVPQNRTKRKDFYRMINRSQSWTWTQRTPYPTIEMFTESLMFSVALFTVAEQGDQSKCPSTDSGSKSPTEIKWNISQL